MYADRYGTGPKLKPVSTTLALAMTALPVVALIAGLQISQNREIDKTFEGYRVPETPPPPPDRIKPIEKAEVKPIIETPYVPPIKPLVETPTKIETTEILTPPGPPQPLPGTGTILEPPKTVELAKPELTGAEIDPRYRSLLQPPFPAEEARAGRSGRVSLRVLIGTDGRVRQVTKISAATDAFYAAAERQALTKWRFKPATRDGVAIEQWKVMNLSFVLNEDQ